MCLSSHYYTSSLAFHVLWTLPLYLVMLASTAVDQLAWALLPRGQTAHKWGHQPLSLVLSDSCIVTLELASPTVPGLWVLPGMLRTHDFQVLGFYLFNFCPRENSCWKYKKRVINEGSMRLLSSEVLLSLFPTVSSFTWDRNRTFLFFLAFYLLYIFYVLLIAEILGYEFFSCFMIMVLRFKFSPCRKLRFIIRLKVLFF